MPRSRRIADTATRATAKPARRGAIVPLFAILLPTIVVLSAFAVNIAWMQLVRTELRTATDAASRAGAKELSLRQDIDAARRAAIDAASRNLVAGQPLRLAPRDVEFGLSAQPTPGTRFAFDLRGTPTNAVRVTGRRTTGSPSGAVGLMFDGVLATRTFEPVQTATSTVLDRDICLVVDRSGSMGLDIGFTGTGNGQNCGPLDGRTRFFALAQAVSAFMAELNLTFPEERVALASYSSNFSTPCGAGRLNYRIANLDQPLTLNYGAVNRVMNDFLTNGIGGSTAIGEGLRVGVRALDRARPFAIKTIVLMTDGRHNLGVEPIVVTAEANAAGAVVHTVTFSPNTDFARMRAVASATGGRHFHADTAADLAAVFREIARTLPVVVTQ
ncbi:MAG: VWA domain-containing protein [Lacipirellulaceae bacterium]